MSKLLPGPGPGACWQLDVGGRPEVPLNAEHWQVQSWASRAFPEVC